MDIMSNISHQDFEFYIYLCFSVKPKEEEKEIIIPLIKTNNWKTQALNKAGAGLSEKENHLDSQAVKELVEGTFEPFLD